MKNTMIALAVALGLAMSPVAAFAEPIIESPGVVTFHFSGTVFGKHFSTVTMNRNNNTMVTNFDDGDQYTSNLEENMFWAMMGMLSLRDQTPSNVNMD